MTPIDEETVAAHAAAPFDRAVTREDVVARIRAHDLGGTPEAMRAGFSRLVLGDVPSGGVPRANGLPVRTRRRGVGGLEVTPPDAVPGWVVVWLHGGGYVFGSPETHVRAAAGLARRVGARVFLPRYRLAPEDAWPAPLDDVLACVHHLQAEGLCVALAGDSAGGHLALVAALALARTPVAGLALFAPNTDRTGLSTTRAANDPHDPMVDDAQDRALAAMAFRDLADDDPQVSPVLGDLATLPPTHVEVGAGEVLLGDSRVLHARASDAGAEVTLHVDGELLHMGQVWTPWWPRADASLARAARHLRRVCGG